jgi:hypothetical protein
MFEPAMPPRLPTEISRPIPTARLEEGARLLAGGLLAVIFLRQRGSEGRYTGPADYVDERTIQPRCNGEQKAISQTR